MKLKVLIDRKGLTMIATKVKIMRIHQYGIIIATKKKNYSFKISISTTRYLGWPFGFTLDKIKNSTMFSLGKVLFRLDVF